MSALRARQASRIKRTEQLSQDIVNLTLQSKLKYNFKNDLNKTNDDTSEIEVYDDTDDNDNFNTEGTYADADNIEELDELHLMKNPMNFTKTKLDISVRQLENFFHINDFDPTIFDELQEVPKTERIYIAAFLFYYHYKNEINQFLSIYPLNTNDKNIYLARYINFLIEKKYFNLNFTNASILLDDRSSNDLFIRIMKIFNVLQQDNPYKDMTYIPQKTLQDEFYKLRKPMVLNYYNTLNPTSLLELLNLINNYSDIEFNKPYENAICDQSIELSFQEKDKMFVEENLVKKLPNILRNIMKIKFNTNRFTLEQLETIIGDHPIISEFIKRFDKCLNEYNTFTKPIKQQKIKNLNSNLKKLKLMDSLYFGPTQTPSDLYVSPTNQYQDLSLKNIDVNNFNPDDYTYGQMRKIAKKLGIDEDLYLPKDLGNKVYEKLIEDNEMDVDRDASELTVLEPEEENIYPTQYFSRGNYSIADIRKKMSKK
jgi:hypothetical protein